MTIRAAILTVSDKASRGERMDTSGAVVRELLSSLDVIVVAYQVVPDEREQIEATLRQWADKEGIDLILTTGGTGLAPRDVTPEATVAVADRLVPGLAEAMRAASYTHTPMAMLSRAQAAIRGRTLIINLPGSEKAVRENLAVVLPVLPHAIETLRGEAGDHVAGPGSAIERSEKH